MKSNLKHIAIAGNIGVGKTSLAKILSKQYGWNLELESVDNNPYLQDFYENMEKYTYSFQSYAFLSRVMLLDLIDYSKE